MPEVRLILATNKDLDVEQHRLREDFLRRIEANTLRIPPLSERVEDVFLFAKAKCGERPQSAGFRLCLLRYSWPRNVGELLDVLKAAVSKTSSSKEPLFPARNGSTRVAPPATRVGCPIRPSLGLLSVRRLNLTCSSD